jgi:Chitobiase/beta-hexosaminidase C-terminal domain
MKKITVSFAVLAAIIAVAILQACAGKSVITQCAKPTLTPPNGSGQSPPIRVTIATATLGAKLRYTTDGSTPTGGPSGHGTPIPAQSGVTPDVYGRTLRAIAFKPGLKDSPIADGDYRISR